MSGAPKTSGGLYGDNGEAGGFDFNAPVHFGSMFGPDSDDEGAGQAPSDEPIYGVETHAFPDGKTLRIRQFDDHITNANAVWPEARFLAGWLCGEREDGSIDRQRLHRMLIDTADADPAHAAAAAAATTTAAATDAAAPAAASVGPSSAPSAPAAPAVRRKRVLELGAACGALSIFLALEGVDMTASDLDDDVVTQNIRANAAANGVSESALRTLPHSWGRDLPRLEQFVRDHGAFDVIVASDILNYEKEFDNLVSTLSVLMPRPHAVDATATSTAADVTGGPRSQCTFWMVWKRRSKGREQQRNFFDLLEAAHFRVHTEGQKVFEITRI